MFSKTMEFKWIDATVPPLFVHCFIWVFASLGKDSLIYVWCSRETFPQMVLEPLQSDKQNATESD